MNCSGDKQRCRSRRGQFEGAADDDEQVRRWSGAQWLKVVKQENWLDWLGEIRLVHEGPLGLVL